MRRCLCPAVLVVAVGCGGAAVDRPVDSGPITFESWREMPVDLKYDDATFQRLREADPKLATEAGWESFLRDVIVPERKKDGLRDPGAPVR